MSIRNQFKLAIFGVVLATSCGVVNNAQAATGVGLTFTGSLATIGNTGGGSSYGTITCPSGQLITGFNFWSQNSGGSLDGKALQAQCSTLAVSGTTVTTTYAGTSAAGGPVSFTQYSGSCPANQVVTGVDAQATTWPVLGWLRLYCSPITYNTTTKMATIQAAPASPSTGIIGPGTAYGGTYYNRVVASSGSALGGFSGTSGASLDSVIFNQYSITQSSLTLTANVTGGSATASSFTLKATDTSNIVTNFTSGQSQIMTPSTYTLSWTGPTGYGLTSITNCSNPVVLANGGVADCFFNFSYQPSISGNVLNDPLGNLTTTTGISSATVRLYNSAGTFISSKVTDASGAFTFTGLAQSTTYYITVASGPSMEQTGANPGSGNSGTAGGAGYGPICVTSEPTYQQQSGTTVSNWNALSGSGFQACYGGRQGAVADANGGTTLTNDEHVIRVTTGTSSDITGVQFSFSPNVVTNTNDSGQGSLRQFITNANTLSGANSMRFVPAITPNMSSGSDKWWQITPGVTGYTTLTGANAASTTIDGTAYSNADGATVLNTNTVTLGDTTTQVGRITSALSGVAGPELEIKATPSGTGPDIFTFSATGTTLRNVAVYGGRIFISNATTTLIEKSIIGTNANSLTDPGTGVRTPDNAISVGTSTGTTLQNNIFAFAGAAGVDIAGGTITSLTLQNNEFRSCGKVNNFTEGFQAISATFSNLLIDHNLFRDNFGYGVDYAGNSGGGTITNNTMNNNGLGGNFQNYGIRASKTDNSAMTIQNNIITNNPGGGISVNSSGTNARGTLITQNIFSTNGGNAIDLGANGVTLNTDACTNANTASSANSGLSRPVIISATLSGSTLVVSGTMCATGTYTLEFYKAAGAGTASGSANNDMGADKRLAGEGAVYLGSLTSQTGGIFSGSISGVSLSSTDSITAIAIRTTALALGQAGDTSEFSANVGFGKIKGIVFEDVAGNQGAQVARSGVNVCGFFDSGDGIPNSSDILVQCTTTAADGSYSLSVDVPGTYWVAVQASTVTPSQGGTGLAEQVYGPIGAQCVDSNYTGVTTRTTAGPCYGGMNGAIADGFSGTVATLANAQHISKVTYSGSDITSHDYGFSFNVVTNVNDAGQGSVRQFINNANSVTGANAMLFVPAVASNAGSGSAAWWKTTLSTAALPVINGSAAASTTIDGKAYSFTDGVTVLTNNNTVLKAAQSVGYDTAATNIGPVNGPSLEINAPGTATYSSLLATTAASTTIQNIAITGGYDFVVRVGAGASGFMLQNSALGMTPGGANALNTYSASYGAALRIGDTTNTTTSSGISGTVQNNVIVSNSNNIYIYGITGLTAGSLVVQKNYLLGTGSVNINTVDINSSANVSFLSNFATSGRGSNLNVWNGSNNATVTGNTFRSSTSGPNALFTSSTGVQFIGNDVQLATGYGVRSDSSANGLYQANLLSNNASGGIVVTVAGGNRITQNIYGNNSRNAIDLNSNGVTINTNACTNADGASSANAGLARPVINTAKLSGTTLSVSGTMCATGTYTLELYKTTGAGTPNGTANNDYGTDNRLAGEGIVYLGSITGQTGGVFSGSVTGVSLTGTDTISATLIKTATGGGAGAVGDTSEFAANVGLGTITGMVFEDVSGNQGAQVARAGVNVCSFLDNGNGSPDAADTFLECVTTASDGTYTLSADYAGTYWVAVQASTVTPSQGGTGLAEQVYAPIGGQCVGSNYTGVTTLTTAGPCYGGMKGAVADGFTGTAATLASAEHISKVTYSGTNITSHDFGFSFNVVTNVNDTGQGSFRQFLANANSVTGANSMRFVPAVAMNKTSWWSVTAATAYPTVTGTNGASTTIDGTAYSYSNGTTVLDNNSVILGDTTTQVGRITGALSGLSGPEFEVLGAISLGAASPTVRNIANRGGINITAGASAVLIEKNVLGTAANSFTDPGAGNRTDYLIFIDYNNINTLAGLTVQNNLIGYSGYSGLSMNNLTITNLNVNNNEFKGNGTVSTVDDAVQMVTGNPGTSAAPAIIDHNLFNVNRNKAMELFSIGGYLQITNNTIKGTVSTQAAVAIHKTGNFLATVQDNIFTANGGQGLVVSNAQATKITKNLFSNNANNAIDLGGNGVTINATSCLNANGANTANSGLARPVIDAAALEGTSLTVEGSVCSAGTYTIEVYQASGAGTANGTANNDMGSDNKLAGEGIAYLGSLTASGGKFSGTLTGVSGLTVGSSSITVTAIRLTGGTVGDTSEFSANFTVQNPNFGSAPDSYKTLKASGGPQHYVFTGLSIGSVVPTSTDGAPVTAYNAAAGGDGITALPFPQLTLAATTYSVTVNATNLTSTPAKLIGWLDFDRNGTFEDTEAVSINVPANTNNGSFTLTWSNVQNLLNLTNPTQGLGPTYARFRLSTDANLTTSTPGGVMSDGEVEDYGGTGVLEIIGRNILGSAFNDSNQNGIFDDNEFGTGLTLYAKLVSYNGTSCTGNALQAATVDPTSGDYSIIGVAPGTWCVILSANNTLTDTTPYTPSGWYYTLNEPGKLLVTVTANANQQDEDFGLSNQAQMKGTVFYDVGRSGGTAYNGIQDGGEKGIDNVTVKITYGAGLTATTVTDAAGNFVLNMPVTTGNVTFSVILPNGTISVSKGVSVFSDSASATSYNAITLDAATVVSGGSGSIRFGLAPVLQLELDTIQAASDGNVVNHPHTFTAGGPGVVTFGYYNQVSRPNNSNWSVALYQDTNCNGVIDSGSDSLISGPLTVTLDQTICLITATSVPLGALSGDQYVQDLTANFVYKSGAITTVATSVATVSETTDVTSGQKLQLFKSVDKSSAQPGDILTYTIVYRNLDLSPITNIVINDDTAPYTTYVANSAKCVTPLPNALSCTVTTNLDSNNQGSVKWILGGALQSGASGTITYQVQIQP